MKAEVMGRKKGGKVERERMMLRGKCGRESEIEIFFS